MIRNLFSRFYVYTKSLMIIVLILISATVFAVQAQQSEQQISPPDSKTLAANIDKYVDPYLQMQDFSGSILISREGKILYEKGFGLANIETKSPNTPQTEFCIGSLNKQLTAAAILLLEEQGKLKTEDAVSTFFPDFPNGDQIKLQHLLTHKSGLPKYVPYQFVNNQEPSSEQILKIISALVPEAKPGEKFSYSNAGFVLLALIIEKVSGKSFPEFLAENIFRPLDMKNSSVGLEKNKSAAHGYVTDIGTAIKLAPKLNVFYFEVYSTVEDLNKWQNGLYNGKLLSASSLTKMTGDYGNKYGYGLSVVKTLHLYYGHDGVSSGFNGFVTYFPDEKLSIVYLGNIESGTLGELQTHIPVIALGKEVTVPQIRELPKKVDTGDFPGYVGRYEVFPGFYLDVKFEGQTLSLRGPQGEFMALTPMSDKEFFYRHLYAKVTFVKDKSQKIARLDWTDGSGNTYPCKKISSEY